MKAPKSVYICSECGYQSARWLGKCPSCSAWNTLEEQVTEEPSVPSTKGRTRISAVTESAAVPYKKLELPEYIRSATGMEELDRVLGGGIVEGSVVLLAGEPGIGKSTLLMQICDVLSARRKVLYISGEESGGQLKYRAQRLGIVGENLYILTETAMDRIIAQIEAISPEFVIVDSIQTMYCEGVASSAGSVSQIKESTMRLIAIAKSRGISVLLVGHVNKEGSIAGPKVMEHMVDAVLSFEGDRQQIFRIIRAVKNRYGSTNEIGVFEMGEKGLSEVANPSELLLSGRPEDASGNCAVCIIQGTRPLITEIQALSAETSFASPRRTANGFDYSRLYLILAVLEKRLGLRLSAVDAYLNVIGGITLDEPAADLAVALSLISSFKDIVIDRSLIAFGELGLSGECRAVSTPELRIREAERLGFETVVLPKRSYDKLMQTKFKTGVKLIPVKSLFDAVRILAK
ncbi:MAG: DNA repair protein RadA [Eubacteriales bacterium]